MARIALGYRDSPLSESHHTGGSLRAGDRVPDLPVRAWADGHWTETSLLSLLDPSRFMLLVNAADDASIPAGFRTAATSEAFARITPAKGKDQSPTLDDILGLDSVTFVRPDGYAGLTSSLASAAPHLDAYRRKWSTGL